MGQWDEGCDEHVDMARQASVHIDNLAQIGLTIIEEVERPCHGCLDHLAQSAAKVERRLRWFAGRLLQQIEETAGALSSPGVESPAPDAASGVSGSPDYASSPAPAQDSHDTAVQVIAVGSGGEDSGGTARRSEQPHDFDQPNILILADADEPWHQQLRAWYNGVLDPVLLAGSLKDAVAAREAAAAQARAADYILVGVTAVSHQDW